MRCATSGSYTAKTGTGVVTPRVCPPIVVRCENCLTQLIKQKSVSWKVAEQLVKLVGQLRTGGKQETILTMAHAFSETGTVVQSTDWKAGAKHVSDFHGQIKT